MAFATLRELLVAEVDYICLQKPVPAEDLEAMQSVDGTYLSRPVLEDFDDTAALVALCDVVVSVDTAVAHLAGAMGQPVWLMLPRRAEWRWLKDRTDSPWYPTARLFRQQEQGDWSTILSTIRSKLTRLAGE
jgi:ADP-heptose:LPS heptosyltransferase